MRYLSQSQEVGVIFEMYLYFSIIKGESNVVMVQPVSSLPLTPRSRTIENFTHKKPKKSEYKSETSIHARSQPPPTSPRLPARPTTRRRLDYPSSSPAAFLLDEVWLAAIAVFLVDGELPCPRRPRPSLPPYSPWELDFFPFSLAGRRPGAAVPHRRTGSMPHSRCHPGDSAAPVRHSLCGHHISGATSIPRLPRRAVGGEVHAPTPLN